MSITPEDLTSHARPSGNDPKTIEEIDSGTDPGIDPEDAPEGGIAPAPGRPSKDLEAARAFAIDAARLVKDLRCEDILIFDVTGASQVTNFILIATGTSDRQIKSVGSEVADLGAESGFERYGSDRDAASTWCVVDMVEVMVHLFEPATRGHYDLEMMWGDAPQLKWRRNPA